MTTIKRFLLLALGLLLSPAVCSAQVATLADSRESLKVVLGSTITTSQPTYYAAWSGPGGPADSVGSTNSTTAVTVLAGSAGGPRTIQSLKVYNADTVAATLTISKVATSGTTYTLTAVTLQPSDTLIWDTNRLQVVDTNGQAKQAASAGTFTLSTITGSSSPFTIAGVATGGNLALAGGANTSTGTGGVASVTGGASGSGATGNGGVGKVVGGAAASTNGTGGAAQVTGGVATGTGTGGAAQVSGGASAGASGTAGSASVDAGSAASGTAGQVNIADTNASATYLNRGALKALVVGQTVTALGTTQNSTPTAAQLLGGIVTQTGATGAGTVTLPTGTALSSAMPRTAVAGDSFTVLFANLGGGQTLTITGASGSTVLGTAAVPTGKCAVMVFINTGTNAWSVYCLVSA